MANEPQKQYAPPPEAGALIDVQTSRPIWKAKNEKCRAYPVKGWLIDRVDMPPAGDGRAWACYIVKLTAPTMCVDRDGKAIKVEPGTEIGIAAGYQLDDTIMGAATSTRFVGYIEISYKDEIPTKNGTMVRYNIKRGANPRERAGFCLPPSHSRAPALPPHGSDAVEDAPF